MCIGDAINNPININYNIILYTGKVVLINVELTQTHPNTCNALTAGV